MPGHFLDRHFDAEIAARHHDAVGRRDNVIEIGDGGRLLDLGEDGGACADQPAHLVHVVGALHERQRYPIDAELQRVREVDFVLFRQWADGEQRVRHRDALARRQHAAGRHLGDDLDGRRLDDAHAQLAVIEHQVVTRCDGLEDLGVGQEHPFARAKASHRGRT